MIFSTKALPGLVCLAAAPLAAGVTVTPANTTILDNGFGVVLYAAQSEETKAKPNFIWSSKNADPEARGESGTLRPSDQENAIVFTPPAGSVGATYLVEVTDPSDGASAIARVKVVAEDREPSEPWFEDISPARMPLRSEMDFSRTLAPVDSRP